MFQFRHCLATAVAVVTTMQATRKTYRPCTARPPRCVRLPCVPDERGRPKAVTTTQLTRWAGRQCLGPGDSLQDTKSRSGARLPLLQALPSGFARIVDILRYVERVE